MKDNPLKKILKKPKHINYEYLLNSNKQKKRDLLI